MKYHPIFRADVAARLNGCIRERLIHRVAMEFSEIKQATRTQACMYVCVYVQRHVAIYVHMIDGEVKA